MFDQIFHDLALAGPIRARPTRDGLLTVELPLNLTPGGLVQLAMLTGCAIRVEPGEAAAAPEPGMGIVRTGLAEQGGLAGRGAGRGGDMAGEASAAPGEERPLEAERRAPAAPALAGKGARKGKDAAAAPA